MTSRKELREKRRARPGGYQCLCGRWFGHQFWLKKHEEACLKKRIESDVRKRQA